MEERIKIINETGERNADGSVRFSSHPAGDPMSGIMEMVHNMLTYGKSYQIEIRNDANKDFRLAGINILVRRP